MAKKKSAKKKAARKKKLPMGRPPVEDPWTTEAALKKLQKQAATGIRMDDIAALHGMGRSTFFALMKKNPQIREHIDRGRAKALHDIAESLTQKALKGDLGAQIFYLKTKGGWKEQQEQAATNMQSVRIVLPGQQKEQVISIGPPEQVVDAEVEDGTAD